MGTHPIFESDFDCLTEKIENMSDEESTDLSELDFDEHHHEHHNQPEDIWGSGEGDTDWSDHEQIMPDLIPERGDEDADEEKDCWICFVRESENPKARWVTPCKCSGTMGHVHQECIKRWVEEKQGDNFNEEVTCPQCNTRYRFAFPEKRVLLQLLRMSNITTKFGVQIVTIGGFVGMLYIGCTFYTRNVLRVMFSTDNSNLLFKTGECLTLEPYFDGVVIPSFRQLVLSGLRCTLSFMLPIHLIRLRAFPWDEWLLKRIDQFEQVEIKIAHKETTGSGGIRSIVGGLAMPFMANIVGKVLFPTQSPFKRWLLGCGTYLTAKGGLTLVRKYKLRRWNRARQVKDFEEGDEDTESEETAATREISIEWSGENILDFRW